MTISGLGLESVGGATTGQSCNASGASAPHHLLPPTFRHVVQGYAFPPSRTTALAVPMAEEPAGVVLVLRVDDTAEALPEALALDHPDGTVTLAKGYRWGVSRHSESARFVIFSHLQYFRVLRWRTSMGFHAFKGLNPVYLSAYPPGRSMAPIEKRHDQQQYHA